PATNPDPEAHRIEGRILRFIDLAAVDEADDAVIAEAVAALERKFEQAPPAERHIVLVFRPQLLKTEAAHRATAARIKPPRGSQIVAGDAVDGAEAHPAGNGELLAHRVISAAVEQGAQVEIRAVAQRRLRIDPRGEAEAARRIEQAVRA